MKLISMTEFVLTKLKKLRGKAPVNGFGTSMEFTDRAEKYAKFLTQPLTLGVFVPCDLEGNVLSEPKPKDFGAHVDWRDIKYVWKDSIDDGNHRRYEKKISQYQQAKDRVVFEGCKVHFDEIDDNEVILEDETGIAWEIDLDNTIESLAMCDLTLTPHAIKQLGL